MTHQVTRVTCLSCRSNQPVSAVDGWALEVSEDTLYKLLPEHVGGSIVHHVLELAEIGYHHNDYDQLSRMVLRAMRMTVAEVLWLPPQ